MSQLKGGLETNERPQMGEDSKGTQGHRTRPYIEYVDQVGQAVITLSR